MYILIAFLLAFTYFGFATYFEWWRDREFPDMFNPASVLPLMACAVWPIALIAAIVAIPFVGLYLLIKKWKTHG